MQTGLTPEEELIMQKLAEAWNEFIKLPVTQTRREDFGRAIREAQRILAARALARMYPEYWI